jgi:sporadic carbohydrate cluster protein (TIGR04323 family)
VNAVRGYIFSRPFMGERVPQHVQNMVIRDYCNKEGLQYLLSATEYAMANSHLILQQVLEELSKLDGIVFYSLFLLPEDEAERNRVINVVFKSNKTIYFAVEGFKMSNKKEQERIESIWQVRKILPHCLQNLTIQR